MGQFFQVIPPNALHFHVPAEDPLAVPVPWGEAPRWKLPVGGHEIRRQSEEFNGALSWPYHVTCLYRYTDTCIILHLYILI